jgi:hypothetical protein
VAWYIDGFNLYHALAALNEPSLKWFDVASLAKSYLRSDQRLERVVFSTALNTWDAEKRARHVAYVKALRHVGVDVMEARFDKARKFCRKHERYCIFNEEKQSDVNLAVAALCDSFEGRVDTVYFLTADSDQVPTFRALRSKFTTLRLNLVAPPGRLAHARELGDLAHNVFELTAGRIRSHLLPAELRDRKDKLIAVRPDAYTDRQETEARPPRS